MIGSLSGLFWKTEHELRTFKSVDLLLQFLNGTFSEFSSGLSLVKIHEDKSIISDSMIQSISQTLNNNFQKRHALCKPRKKENLHAKSLPFTRVRHHHAYLESLKSLLELKIKPITKLNLISFGISANLWHFLRSTQSLEQNNRKIKGKTLCVCMWTLLKL